MPLGVVERFWSKVHRTDECWEWTGVTVDGYGCFRVAGKTLRSHRFAYDLLVGPLVRGLVIDHLCRNRACVNPAHLEQVTQGENVRRGAPAALHRAKTHCPRGHVYDAANTYIKLPRGERQCRACARDRMSRRRKREVA